MVGWEVRLQKSVLCQVGRKTFTQSFQWRGADDRKCESLSTLGARYYTSLNSLLAVLLITRSYTVNKIQLLE